MQRFEQRQLNLILFRETHWLAMLSPRPLTANSKLKRPSADDVVDFHLELHVGYARAGPLNTSS